MRQMYGFSLTELMAVVAIIGVLVTLAMPRYRTFIARSRMAEAKSNLAAILFLQKGYRTEYSSHAPVFSYGGCVHGCAAAQKNELGFRVDDCDRLRYVYVPDSGYGANAHGNQANCRIYPKCNQDDQWTIKGNNTLIHTTNVVGLCSN